MNDEMMRKYEMRKTMLQHIGAGNILSISGGRVKPIENGIEMPVSNGYLVRVEYNRALDFYSVERIFRRKGKEFSHGKAERVFCSELANMAYRAGMFRSFDESQWLA